MRKLEQALIVVVTVYCVERARFDAVLPVERKGDRQLVVQEAALRRWWRRGS